MAAMTAMNPVEPRNVSAEAREQEFSQLLARASAPKVKNARILAERAAQAAQAESSRVTLASPAADFQTALREARLQASLAEAVLGYARMEMRRVTGNAPASLLHEAEVDVQTAEQAASAATACVAAIKTHIPPTTTQPLLNTRELEVIAITSRSLARQVIIRSALVAIRAIFARSDLIEARSNNTVQSAQQVVENTKKYFKEASAFLAEVEETLARLDPATSATLTQDHSLARAAFTFTLQTVEDARKHLNQLRAANHPSTPRPSPPTPRPPAKTATNPTRPRAPTPRPLTKTTT